MNRRGFLRGTTVAGSVGVAGCLERLGFEEQSTWSNPPLVETDTVFPVNVQLEVLHDGDSTGEQRSPWSMLFQRMVSLAVEADTPTPYNDIILPLASLSVTIEQDGTNVLEDEPLTVSVDTPPQISRHDGYETTFFGFEDVTDIV
ncbi:DUF7350 domain-containing protein [Natronorubrum bangense]|uniref:DUF7350 domain-containing protein n=1 Tax=Natronorubrum bangense TaxID=61858 RepID=A0A4D6HVE3_9EURY|nr:twin-arginine translocation signal domain-containing protein [Natronorubrum bangense]QCC56837.1 hypothetical protein DV706_20090 [Natronorubrum bangense]